jgi:hypothetical protein
MNWKTILLSFVLVGFLGLSAYAIAGVGYVGLFTSQMASWGGIQVFGDLVIMGALAIIWMVGDARKRGANAWPYVVITLFAGSIGPLLYLLQREWGGRRTAANALQRA